MLENVEYLPLKSTFKIGDVKNLAVLTNQKDDISKSYPKIQSSTVSNADMLSQSFNTNPVPEIPKVEPVVEPIQVSAIPNVQNNFNMEASPVDLNVNPVSVPPVNNVPTMDINVPTIDSVNSNQENSIPQVPVIEPINSGLENNVSLPSTPIEETNGFQVSTEPNIFDNPLPEPFAISQEDINKPLENNELNAVNGMDNNLSKINIFNQPNFESNNLVKEESPIITPEVSEISDNSINEDIVLAQIAIEESNVKHYEALAENSKKKIELLKRQVKTNVKKEETNLENTASNLFNSNGILDEEKVLGKTPMPNIMAA